MRSIRLLAATSVILLGVAACGGDNGPDENDPPVAIFTAPIGCTTAAACNFTDASTDPDGDALTRSWDFGDDSDPSPTGSHQYTAANTYTVTLTVTDPDGASNSISHDVVIGAGGGGTNTPPVASFTVPTCTVNSACPFADASTDAEGQQTIVAWLWTFPDGSTQTTQNTNYTFAAEGSQPVTLQVTDNQGATHSVTQNVTVGAPSATQCNTVSDSEVDCVLAFTSRSTVTLTLTGVACELGGQLVLIPPPGPDQAQNVFGNVCHEPDQAPVTLTNEAGAPLVVEAGQSLTVRLRRGTSTSIPPGEPAGNISGSAPTWTLNFDDGGNPGGAGEPDFGDVVVTVQANAAP